MLETTISALCTPRAPYPSENAAFRLVLALLLTVLNQNKNHGPRFRSAQRRQGLMRRPRELLSRLRAVGPYEGCPLGAYTGILSWPLLQSLLRFMPFLLRESIVASSERLHVIQAHNACFSRCPGSRAGCWPATSRRGGHGASASRLPEGLGWRHLEDSNNQGH